MIKRPLNIRFADKVEAGIKVTTIRDKPWPVGVPIMLYHWSGAGFRSKQQDSAAVIVEETTPILISRGCDGMLYEPTKQIITVPLWQAEGFDSESDMDEWFIAKMKQKVVTKNLMRFRIHKP